MSTQSAAISAPLAPTSARIYNPWFIALAVVVPTLMEVLDTTIANVALRYMAGGLSAPPTASGSSPATSRLMRLSCPCPDGSP